MSIKKVFAGQKMRFKSIKRKFMTMKKVGKSIKKTKIA